MTRGGTLVTVTLREYLLQVQYCRGTHLQCCQTLRALIQALEGFARGLFYNPYIVGVRRGGESVLATAQP